MGLDGEPLEISLLGNFAIRCQNHEVADPSVRTKKTWMLIQYLIANRKKEIPIEQILLDIWGAESSHDPFNVLKNAIYRARTLLKQLCPDADAEFILYQKGTYLWNPAFDWKIDTELFEEYIQTAENAADNDEKIVAYRQAIDLYKGRFLPKSAYCNWVVQKSNYYATLYVTCTVKLCKLLEQQERFEEMIPLCETATKLYAFEEKIHQQLLRAYIETKRYSRALAHYNYITEIFYDKMGSGLSDDTKELYQQIIRNISTIEMDLSIICEDLNESCQHTRAFFCDYENFKNIYRLQARSIMRTGQSIHIALLSLSRDPALDQDSDVVKKAMVNLKEMILLNLRKGDAIAPFSGLQYVLMLTDTTYENAEKVCNRIVEKYFKKYLEDDFKIVVHIRPVQAIRE